MKLHHSLFRLVLAFSILVLLLTGFYGFSRLVRSGSLNNPDLSFTVKLQDAIDKSSRLRTSALIGDVLEGSVILASPAASLILLVILTGILAIRLRPLRFRWQAILFPLGFVLMTLIEVYGKTVIEHPSPPFFLLKNPTTHFPAHHIIEAYSYPSGHAARSLHLAVMAVAAGISLSGRSFKMLFRKIWFLSFCLMSLVFCLSVSLSVVYLGHHWASDVVGGFLITLAFAIPAAIIFLL